MVRGKKVQIDEVSFGNIESFKEVKRLVKQYNLDIVDAMQMVTVMKGKYSVYSSDSKSLFITADKDLAKAAKKEGILVWDCIDKPVPT